MQDNYRLQQILQATSEGWWEWDLATNKTFHSSGWYKMLGYEQHEFNSSLEMWLSLIHPEDQKRAFDQQDAAMKQNDAWEIEFRMRSKQQEYIWITSRGRVVKRDPAGNPLLVVGIHININQKKELEHIKQLHARQEELMKGILRVSFASVNVYDFLNQKMVYCQWLVFKKLGYEESDFGPMSENFFINVIHPDDLWILQNHLQKIQQAKLNDVLECVIRFKNKQGAFHWIAIRDSVLQWTPEGGVEQTIGSAVDITRFKEIKVKIDENLALLENLSFRNSHELRAPVATILGLINLIRYELRTEGSIQELITALEQTVDRMDRVINEFNKALS